MNTTRLSAAVLLASLCLPLTAAEPSIDTMPPVVVKTVPEAGSTNVPPGEFVIKVTFSKPMMDQTWSWSTAWEKSDPETIGQPKYEADGRTCVLKVKLEPNQSYGYWLNSQHFKNFKDTGGQPAVPYLLTFRTSGGPARDSASADTKATAADAVLHDDQRRVLAWTLRQFRGFFDERSFDGWSEEERSNLAARLIDTLRGPVTREYDQAIWWDGQAEPDQLAASLAEADAKFLADLPPLTNGGF